MENKEIKEIIECAKKVVFHKVGMQLDTKQVKILLNYINNLENRIDKAIEYLTSYENIETIQQCEHSENNKGLDKKTIIEMTRRYLIVHDKLLDILKGDDIN